MKVWGLSLGESRRIVATRYKKEAAAAFGVPIKVLTDYGCVTHNEEEIELAIAAPGVVFERDNRFGSQYKPKMGRAK